MVGVVAAAETAGKRGHSVFRCRSAETQGINAYCPLFPSLKAREFLRAPQPAWATSSVPMPAGAGPSSRPPPGEGLRARFPAPQAACESSDNSAQSHNAGTAAFRHGAAPAHSRNYAAHPETVPRTRRNIARTKRHRTAHCGTFRHYARHDRFSPNRLHDKGLRRKGLFGKGRYGITRRNETAHSGKSRSELCGNGDCDGGPQRGGAGPRQ